MAELQAPANISSDPRWIAIRVSRINLAISAAGLVLAVPIMLLMERLPLTLRLSISLLFILAMAWDLHLILLKGRRSVRAFYLFDRDPPKMNDVVPEAASKLGIRVQFAGAPLLEGDPGREGEVLSGAFVSPWFATLRYRLPDDPTWRRFWPRIIPLWRDSLDAEEFRKVRVALKWK